MGFVVTIYKDSAKFRLSKEKAKNFSFKGQKETEADFRFSILSFGEQVNDLGGGQVTGTWFKGEDL